MLKSQQIIFNCNNFNDNRPECQYCLKLYPVDNAIIMVSVTFYSMDTDLSGEQYWPLEQPVPPSFGNNGGSNNFDTHVFQIISGDKMSALLH